MEISEYPRNKGRWLFDFSFTVGKPEVFGLKAIQDPQWESRGCGCCRYPSPDKTHTRTTPLVMAGFLLSTYMGDMSGQINPSDRGGDS